MIKPNAAVLFGMHGSLEGMTNKTDNNLDRVSEFMVLDKISKRFDRFFVFSFDSKRKDSILPKNAIHVRLFNQLLYAFFGWFVLLYYIHKNRIRFIYLECSALPLVFMINRLSKATVFLNYNYLLHKIYLADKDSSIKSRITKNRFMPFIIKHIERFLLGFVDYIVVGSKEIEQFVPSKKIIRIKKGIVVSKFNPTLTKSHDIYKKIKGPSVLMIARLTNVKNPLLMIDSYKLAKKKIPDLNLIICGDGRLFEECRRAADDNVHLLGFVGDIPSILKGADVFVNPSDYDASPRSLMEAMTMGVPCVATKVGGVPDYIDETCGILVEPKKPKLLADKIVYLIKNKNVSRELGTRARKRMLRYHDLDKNLSKTIDIVIERKKR